MGRICPGPGVQCQNPACPWWQGDAPGALDTSNWGGLVSTRGKIVDHWALSVADLTATVARLKREGVKFLEEIHPWGNMRAAMIEGPDRIAIELVEVK